MAEPLELPPLPPPADGRCEMCGWTLAASVDEGCVPGNCSFRPAEGSPEWHVQQKNRADAEKRAKAMRTYGEQCARKAAEERDSFDRRIGELEEDVRRRSKAYNELYERAEQAEAGTVKAVAEALERAAALLGDDSAAITYQSMRQYRTEMIGAIRRLAQDYAQRADRD